MPPRHAYWTIIVDDQPTAFRAHDAEELEPTLNRLKEKHPSAVMRWFERGKLWESRDAARAEGFGRGERRWEGPRPDRPESPAGDTARESRRHGEEEKPRDRKWRPGGDHRDPRQKYQDAKKAKWDRFKKNLRDRADKKREPSTSDADPKQFTPPHGDPLRDRIDERTGKKPWRPTGDRDRRPAPRSSNDRYSGRQSNDWHDRDRPRPEWRDRPPKGDWKDRPPERRSRPQGDWRDRPQGEWRDRPQGDRRDRPQGDRRDRPQGDRRDRPPKRDLRDRSAGDRRERPQQDWRDRPKGDQRERPQGNWRARPKGQWQDRPKGESQGRPKGDWRDRAPGGRRPFKARDDERSQKDRRKAWGAKSQAHSRPKGSKPFGGSKPGGPRRSKGPRGPRKRRDDE
jgi:23S rRNA pseudouridine2605 synthase